MQLVSVALIELLHNVESAFAKGLSHGVKKDQDEVAELAWKPRQWQKKGVNLQ